MGFDSASSIAEAFDKLKSGGLQPTEKVETEEPKVSDRVAEEESEKPVIPTAEELSKLHGGKKAKSPESSEANEDLPKEANSLKKWAVNMKKDWKAEKALREELELKVAELEKARSTADPEEIQKLRQKNEEYERELQISRVEATQEFKDAVVAPMMQLRGDIDALSNKYEVPQRDIFQALSESDPSVRADKLSDIAAGMNDRDKYSLYEMENKYQKIESTREKVVTHAKLALQKIQEHRDEQIKLQQAESAKMYNSAFSQVWEMTQKNLPMLRHVEGDDAWNAQIDDIVKTAANPNFESLDDAERAKFAIRSAAAPLLVNQFVNLYNKYQELEKAMAKYQTVTPKAGGGGSSAPASSEEFDGFLEAISAKLKSN